MLSRAATAIPIAATHSSDSSGLVATLAATLHTAGLVATVLLIVTVAVAFYLFTCVVWPFGKCRRCKGVGKFKSPFGCAYRHCGKCQGSGLRVRLGRHVINHLRAVRGAGENSTSKGKRS
ncbi:hypothetical protein [Kribbella sp. VKM Ac-2566]|uniref:hypothetical protein n=1 Tax=Kribbella sp. VKM Ac-2566 TaxID=2512218 RepID=UPI001064055F|nr:hypothetical protein [Kribbella sp. VKM Ac-2566]TDW98067.1 hypothetical protein EV647_2762 [Kribbella sp. VKM Ac-2566]